MSTIQLSMAACYISCYLAIYHDIYSVASWYMYAAGFCREFKVAKVWLKHLLHLSMPHCKCRSYILTQGTSNLLTATIYGWMFKTHHHWVIPAVCRPLLHLCCPRSHHTLYPRYCWSTPPLVPPVLCDLPPASHHQCCRLDPKNTSI